jgi:hypothetical protein
MGAFIDRQASIPIGLGIKALYPVGQPECTFGNKVSYHQILKNHIVPFEIWQFRIMQAAFNDEVERQAKARDKPPSVVRRELLYGGSYLERMGQH